MTPMKPLLISCRNNSLRSPAHEMNSPCEMIDCVINCTLNGRPIRIKAIHELGVHYVKADGTGYREVGTPSPNTPPFHFQTDGRRGQRLCLTPHDRETTECPDRRLAPPRPTHRRTKVISRPYHGPVAVTSRLCHAFTSPAESATRAV